MPEPFESASLAESKDPETQAMVRRIQARLFDMPVEPVRVGRFELVRVIGSGGMGVVHLGRDELLDRHVAIKLIRSERTQAETARRRLLREAQAMARLSHPNVVQVYEAGEHAGRVFVAMEFVEGQTLRRWIDGDGRTQPWRDRLRVLRAAGLGLAAAHRAGVVHRDFKPENVLLDRTNEPKVGDFGLAGVDAPPCSTSSDDGSDDGSSGSSGPPGRDDGSPSSLTQTGAVMGTPLYMAPEQLQAGTVDARTDQFAFCVVAYELLVGQRPFEGETVMALSERVSLGAVRPVPSSCPTPRWLLAVILRGLQVDPERRWPSMDALIQAMAPRRWRLGVLVASAMAGLGLALGLAWAWPDPASSSEAGSRCERGRSELADAWGPARREATERALHETGLPYADDTFTRVAAALDGYARDWADGYYQTCNDEEAGRPVGARMACLERARDELQLLTDELLAAHPQVVRHAADLVLSLPELERCDDPTSAELEVASFEDPEVRALLDRLTRATVLAESWQFAEADTLLGELGATARTMQLDPLVARIGVLRSSVAVSRDEIDEAKRFASDALAAAERAEHDELELLAWRRLAAVSRREGELSRAAFELERAEAIAERPTISAKHRADLRFDQADLLWRQLEPQKAVAAYEDARAAYHALSPEHPQIVAVLSDMSLALLAVGRQAEGFAASERALAIQTQRLGPRHPSLVRALSGVADQYAAAGRTDDAFELRQQALAILEQQPTENPEQQVVLAAVASGDLVSLRRFDEAERLLAQADRTASERLPAEHPAVALIANTRGNLELDRRRHAEAVPHYEHALALTPNAATLNRLVMLNNLAYALARAGRTDEALARAEQARAALEPLAADSATRIAVEIYLAEVDRLADRHAQAEASFTRALELLDRVELGDDLRVMVLFGLARLVPDDRARARDHASKAKALADQLPGFEQERDEIATWLAEHPDR